MFNPKSCQWSTVYFCPDIYKNHILEDIKRYSTDVYLFCLHKDPLDPTKLGPHWMHTAIWQIRVGHVARMLWNKFTDHLIPYNYAVGVPNGYDFVIKAM